MDNLVVLECWTAECLFWRAALCLWAAALLFWQPNLAGWQSLEDVRDASDE